jgi:hypothetical protein
MLRRAALVRTDVSEERITTIRVTVFLRSVVRFLVTANVPSSPIIVTLMMQVIRPSETSVLTRGAWCNIPEDGIFHSPRRENLKSDMISGSSRPEGLRFLECTCTCSANAHCMETPKPRHLSL